MNYFRDEYEEWIEGPTNQETILKAIKRLKEDIVRIETCKSINEYVSGPKDIIHERVDGLIEHIENIFELGYFDPSIADFKSSIDKHDEIMGRDDWDVIFNK